MGVSPFYPCCYAAVFKMQLFDNLNDDVFAWAFSVGLCLLSINIIFMENFSKPPEQETRQQNPSINKVKRNPLPPINWSLNYSFPTQREKLYIEKQPKKVKRKQRVLQRNGSGP